MEQDKEKKESNGPSGGQKRSLSDLMGDSSTEAPSWGSSSGTGSGTGGGDDAATQEKPKKRVGFAASPPRPATSASSSTSTSSSKPAAAFSFGGSSLMNPALDSEEEEEEVPEHEDSNKIVRIHFVNSKQTEPVQYQASAFVHPTFTNQLYENERIKGFEDLRVNLYYIADTLRVYADVTEQNKKLDFFRGMIKISSV